MGRDPRLTSGFWITAYMARLRLNDIPHFLRKRGDKTAGAILVLVNTLDGNAKLYQRGMAFDGPRGWGVLAEGSERDVDEAMTRQITYDPDLWVVEVEHADGRHLLDEPGLAD